MKKLFIAILVNLLLVSFAMAGGSADEAKEMVGKAVTYYKANGKAKALAEFSNSKGQFIKGELYIFVWDLNGIVIAHGTNPKLINKDMSQLKDVDGKQFVYDGVQLAKAKGSGWVDYKWSNPVTQKVEAKSTYVQKVDDIVICCGIYK